jgi:TRAP-type C4-dicarboxylate transport system substrate-binding protein
MSIVRSLAVLAAVWTITAPASAQTTLDLINEYPANSITGEADAFFADAVRRRSEGRIVVRPVPDAKSGVRTRDQLKAVAEGKFAMADSFAGGLGEDSAAFLLSSLPFVAPTMEDVRALYAAARPLYERLFAERKQKLLYVTPWPPSGIWSAQPLAGIGALKALKIRTYDKTSTEVLSRVAESAINVSFADLAPKLEAGEINAVLSSGDGGAGRQLWKYLANFTEVGYAAPLSLASISLAVWSSLDEAGRNAIEAAAQETSEHQWAALAGRLSENYARMRANGVTIDHKPSAELLAALRGAADASIADWLSRAGPDAKEVFERYREQKK